MGQGEQAGKETRSETGYATLEKGKQVWPKVVGGKVLNLPTKCSPGDQSVGLGFFPTFIWRTEREDGTHSFSRCWLSSYCVQTGVPSAGKQAWASRRTCKGCFQSKVPELIWCPLCLYLLVKDASYPWARIPAPFKVFLIRLRIECAWNRLIGGHQI